MTHFPPRSPKGVVMLVLRLSFGLSLLFVGVTHYMTLSSFVGMVNGGLGALTPLGTVWAYVLPALMIVGGALFAVGMYYEIAAWTSAIALGSIPPGMLLKPVLSGVPLPEVMPWAINAFIWLIVLVLVVKYCCGCCCGSKDCPVCNGSVGAGGSCGCC